MKKILVIISVIFSAATMASAQSGAKGELALARRSVGVEKKASASVKKREARSPGVLRVGPSTTYLKNGLRAEEVLRFLGQPMMVSERQDGSLSLATYTFARGGGRVLVAEFGNNVLVNSRMEAGQTLAQCEEPGR